MLTDDPTAPLILVVEDDDSHADLIRRSFWETSEKFCLVRVGTLGAARDAIERHPPDLVLADYFLPDGEGSDLLQTVKGLCPIVLMTSQGNERVAVDVLKGGAQDYVVKSPVVFAAMSNIVQRTLREWAFIQGKMRAEEALRVHQIELELQNEELCRAQAELATSQARYFDLYDLAPVGYLTLSEKYMIQEVNLAAATMLGVVRGSLVKEPISRILLSRDLNIFFRQRTLCLETNSPKVWEMRLLRADGSTFWAHLQVTPAENGECWITFSDITERKQTEEEKLLLERQLQQAQKLESLGVLAGGIAHDFNNILTVIVSNCFLAMERPEMAGKLIPEIEKAANRAAELCRQMLVYAGKSLPFMGAVDMAVLVDDMLKMLKPTISQNAVIKSCFAADLPPIRGDVGQLRQIIMNLVINASEAISERQGEIRVSLTETVVAEGQSETDHLGIVIAAGPYVCLEVTDTGCGMDDESKQRIFEPFYTTKFTGRGLGMSAVLGIIAAHSGALQLTSRPGHGTTFKVLLPVQFSGSAGDGLLQPLPRAPWQGSGTILLVEDEPQVLMVTKTMLEGLGFTVIEAADGKEALEQYQKNAEGITLVVTDIGMPVMDGYELVPRLKALAPDLPIIISSGFGDMPVALRIAAGEAAGYLNKPYSFEQMQEVLKNTVESRPGNPHFNPKEQDSQ